MRSSARRFFVCALAAAGASLASIPSYAQAPAGSRSEPVNPISKSELEKFLVVGSINTCILAQEKVGFQTAVRANATSLYALVSSLHGSQVLGENNGKPMSEQQLFQGLALQVSALTVERCPKVIPEKDIAEIKKAFAELEKLDQQNKPAQKK
jgi:hypothetical protein